MTLVLAGVAPDLAATLVARLGARGNCVQAEDEATSLAALVQAGSGLRGVVCGLEQHARGSLASLSPADWQGSFDATARAPWRVLRAAAPLLRQSRGALVQLDATTGVGDGVYATAKAASVFLARALGHELAPHGVRVNVVAPGEPRATAALLTHLLGEDAAGLVGQRIEVASSASCGSVAAMPPRGERDVPVPRPVSSLLVTGGAGEIARAAIRALARDNAVHGSGTTPLRVLLVDRDPPRLAAAARDLIAMGIHASTLTGDFLDATLPERAVAQALATAGHLDAVLATAAVAEGASVSTLDDAAWERTFAVNVRAFWLLARAAHPALTASGGSLTATASIGALAPGLSAPVYSASKAALVRLVEELALQWAADGVRVNVVSPGPTLTPMNRHWSLPAAERARAAAAYPLARMATPDEIGAMLAFLAGPRASYVSGSQIVVDGAVSLAARAATRTSDR